MTDIDNNEVIRAAAQTVGEPADLKMKRIPTLPDDNRTGWMSLIRPGPVSVLCGVVTKPPTLATMQKMVGGGLVELIVDMHTITKPSIRVQVFCNEDGISKRLPPNASATIWANANLGLEFRTPILGNVVILSGTPALWR